MSFDGTFNRGTATFTTGKFGNAESGAVYDLGNPDIPFSSNDATSGGNLTTGTVEWWMLGGGSGIPLVHTNWYQIQTSGASNQNLYCQFGNSFQASILTTSSPLTNGVWHHVAIVFNAGTISVYVDGNLCGSTSTAAPVLAGNVGLGGSISFSGNEYTSQIDELRFSDNARYTGASFTVPVTAFADDSDTLALYHLESNAADSHAATTAFTSNGTPTISGSATVGSTLTAATGTWTPTPDSYTYQWNHGGTSISNANASNYVVANADGGTALTVTVTAIKAGFTSTSATSAATATVPSSAPGQVTNLSANAGNTQVSLSWATPATGGSAISDYLVEYASGGAYTTFAHSAQTNTTIAVTGLTNNTTYTFRVSAINSSGTGPASAAASATPGAVSGVIPPNDPNIIYSPFNWTVTGSQSQAVSGGAYFRTYIVGSATSITANFNVSGASGTQRLAIYVDGNPYTVLPLAATISIPLSGTGWNKHLIELVFYNITGTDLWTSPTGTVKFTGFSVAPGAVATAPTRRRPFNILALGDSITNGYVTSGAGYTDTRLGWAFSLRDLLGAEIGISGFNAQGYTNPGDGNVPNFTNTYNYIYSGSSRSFTAPQPDLVLINMGTNDGSSTDITTPATNVLNGILAATTTTKIAIIQQWNGTTHKSQYQAAIAACVAPSRVSYIDTTGWLLSADTVDGTHPQGYINLADLSPRIATSVLPLLNGATVTSGGGSTFTPRRFLNKNGTALAIQ